MKDSVQRSIRLDWWGLAIVLVAAVGLFWLTELPYQYADKTALSHDGQWVFSGYLHYPEDMETYKAFMAQSARGRWLFIEPAFKEKQHGAYFNLLWLIGGKLQWLFGASFDSVFAFFRLLGWVLLLLGVYLLLRHIVRSSVGAAFLALLSVFVSGIGWVSILPSKVPQAVQDYSPALRTTYMFFFHIGSWLRALLSLPEHLPPSPDIYTETSGFFQAAWLPHVAINIGLLLVAAYFLLGLLRPDGRGRPTFALPGLIGAAIVLIRPYEFVPFFGLYLLVAGFVAYSAYRKEGRAAAVLVLKNAGLWALPSLAGAIYYAWLVYVNPLWRVWGTANSYPAPDVLIFLRAFFWGLVAYVALTAAMLYRVLVGKLRKKKLPAGSFEHSAVGLFVLWVLFVLVAIYSGIFGFAWRLTAAFGILVSVGLAIALYRLGFVPLFALLKNRMVSVLVSVVVSLAVFVLVSPSNLHSYIEKFEISNRFNRYYFLERPVKEAMEWAGANVPAGSVIFTHGFYGLKLPSYGDFRPVLWHKDQTPLFVQRKADYYAFLNTDIPEDRERILGYYGVDVVFWGIVDRNQSQYPNLDGLPFLSKIYENEFVSIYAVLKDKIRYNSLPEYLR